MAYWTYLYPHLHKPYQFIRSVIITSCYVICEEICIVGIDFVRWHNFALGFSPSVQAFLLVRRMRKDKQLLTYAFSLNCSGWTRKNVNIRTTSQSEIGTLFLWGQFHSQIRVKLGHRMAALFGRRESKRGKLKGTVESACACFILSMKISVVEFFECVTFLWLRMRLLVTFSE